MSALLCTYFWILNPGLKSLNTSKPTPTLFPAGVSSLGSGLGVENFTLCEEFLGLDFGSLLARISDDWQIIYTDSLKLFFQLTCLFRTCSTSLWFPFECIKSTNVLCSWSVCLLYGAYNIPTSSL